MNATSVTMPKLHMGSQRVGWISGSQHMGLGIELGFLLTLSHAIHPGFTVLIHSLGHAKGRFYTSLLLFMRLMLSELLTLNLNLKEQQ